ncbi:hypothetical protein [Inconstantimicrobium mannanitabidum]|uniref:Uncharacterized protein n=1 Tax=Inconstantimicrobium mannanitabidum TaxID=1604901 RepID=A0ACB5R7B4_9CLOT|nr:hypothetical protein [Clostridium sp. TW13]GKX65082.1 hypothetical protein rsdtw13_03400 [Clostridium sp. TW13]
MFFKEKFIKYLEANKIPFRKEESLLFLKIKGSNEESFEVYLRFDENSIALGLAKGLTYEKDREIDVLEILNEINSLEDNYIKFKVCNGMILSDVNIPILSADINYKKLEEIILDFVATMEMYLRDIYEVLEEEV